MKKNKNTIAIVFLCIILFLGGILIFISFSTIETNLDKILNSINYTKYIKESKRINSILDKKKIPIEIFDYLDEDKIIKNIEDNTVDNKRVTKILRNSITKYEDKYEVSIYDNITSEIDDITKIITNKINEIYEIYEGVKSLTHSLYIFLATAFLLTIFLIVKKEFVRTGTSYVVISIVSYYIIRTYFKSAFKSITNTIIDKIIVDNLTKVYTIYLCIGIILLLINIIIFVKEIYDKSKDWR